MQVRIDDPELASRLSTPYRIETNSFKLEPIHSSALRDPAPQIDSND